jgi:hypothetical protein
MVLVLVSWETQKARGELNQAFSRQIRESAFLKLRIKIAYKNCIFDQIGHCAYLYTLDQTNTTVVMIRT